MLRRRGQILYTNDVNLVFVCLCEILTDTIACVSVNKIILIQDFISIEYSANVIVIMPKNVEI